MYVGEEEDMVMVPSQIVEIKEAEQTPDSRELLIDDQVRGLLGNHRLTTGSGSCFRSMIRSRALIDAISM